MAISTLPQSLPPTPIKVWTDQELMALPDDGNKYELVDGELIVSNSGLEHGYIAAILVSALYGFVVSRKLGVVFEKLKFFYTFSKKI